MARLAPARPTPSEVPPSNPPPRPTAIPRPATGMVPGGISPAPANSLSCPCFDRLSMRSQRPINRGEKRHNIKRLIKNDGTMFPERRHLTWWRKPGTSPGGNVDHRHSTRPCANTTRPNFPYPIVIKHKTTPNRPPGCTEKYAKVQIGPQRYAFPPNRNGETPKTRPFPPPTFATEIAISAPRVHIPPPALQAG
jgi:hypothetical protein